MGSIPNVCGNIPEDIFLISRAVGRRTEVFEANPDYEDAGELGNGIWDELMPRTSSLPTWLFDIY